MILSPDAVIFNFKVEFNAVLLQGRGGFASLPSPTPAAIMSEPHDPSKLPKRTTPTWEVELLISGVAVFAMLQLPGWLDQGLFALAPRLERGLASALTVMHTYLKAAALILATTFSIHLLLRAQWIALVGAYSVFPDGVRWERLRLGPIRREVEQRGEKSPADAIDAADNRATLVFALGVSMASTLLWISLSIGVLFLIGLGLLRVFGIDMNASRVFALCAAAFMLPLVVALQIDRFLGGRLRRQGALWRTTAAVLDFYRKLGIGRGANVLGLIASHGGDRRIGALTIAVVLVGMVVAMYSTQWRRDPQSLGGYALFPSGREVQPVDAAHYDDERDPASDPPVPYVQSAIVDGPYLKLVVPYRPGDDDAAMRRRCPGALAAREAQAALVLACLSASHALRIDGKPLPGLRYESGEDPRTDRPALLAMIDVRGLVAGRHVLTVERAPTRADEKSAGPDVIPFWR